MKKIRVRVEQGIEQTSIPYIRLYSILIRNKYYNIAIPQLIRITDVKRSEFDYVHSQLGSKA